MVLGRLFVLTIDSVTRYADLDTAVGVTLLADDGVTPVVGAQVLLERRVDPVWSEVGALVTDETGRAEVDQTLARDVGDNLFRATYAGDATYAGASSGRYLAPIQRRASVVTVGGPDRVVDEESIELRLHWRTSNGLPFEGRVELQRRDAGEKAWERIRRLRTNPDGRAALEVRPRVDTRWRVIAPGLDWVRRDRSPVHRVDNLPPGVPANATVATIPDGVWDQMTGRSWHQGCPVGRAGLRLLQGADDYRSMAAGNTSGFNCRHVVGRPGVRSPHSYGRSLDINPWENPYGSSGGWVPNSWWVTRSHPRVAWRSREHAVVSLMARHGLRWTYGTSDAHHFDVAAGSGRVITLRAAACDTTVCH